MLNKQKGNMYPWVTHTWNVIKGKCFHDCEYCYMKRFPQKKIRFDEKEMKTDLGSGNTIFVGSSCDMFAEGLPGYWIIRILNHTISYPDNTYLFQSKNPQRFFDHIMPRNVILATTIETNRDYKVSKAPSVIIRGHAMQKVRTKKMISIEPILDFDVDIFLGMLSIIQPDFVSIGADSKGHGLPEPDKEKLEEFITKLKKFTEVKTKNNLERLL